MLDLTCRFQARRSLTPRDTFNAIPDETTGKYRGQPFTVIRLLTAHEADIEEAGPMALVRFADGFETAAFPEEIWMEWTWTAVVEAGQEGV